MTSVIDLGDLTIRSISVSAMDNNVYLITHRRSGAQVLIDAADDAAAISDLLAQGASDAEGPTELAFIVTTHSHWDHVRALGEVARATGARTAAGAVDVPAIAVPTDVALHDGDMLTVDGFVLEVIHLRGHTPGSVALMLDLAGRPTHIFTGDSLFPGGVGKTGSPTAFTSLLEDVTGRVFDRFDDDTVILPGHGQPTTLAAERPELPQWRARGW